jgi:hypothetical protein
MPGTYISKKSPFLYNGYFTIDWFLIGVGILNKMLKRCYSNKEESLLHFYLK